MNKQGRKKRGKKKRFKVEEKTSGIGYPTVYVRSSRELSNVEQRDESETDEITDSSVSCNSHLAFSGVVLKTLS